MPTRRLRLLLAVLAAFAAALAAPAHAAIGIHAHRGGPLVHGAPVFAENSLPAFQNAAAGGHVLEFDIKLSKDDVPVVIHDDTLDRTTTCTGLVSSKTAAELAGCEIDYLGRPGEGQPSAFIADPAQRPHIPTLAQVLALAAATDSTINAEIKNIPPTSPAALAANDFDPTFAYARKVSSALHNGPLPQHRIIVQSFWPPNLMVARRILRGADISLLTLKPFNDGAPALATAMGWEWVSPEFSTGLNPGIVPLAHALRRQVVPYTLNTAATLLKAQAQGVDAVITDDPALAETVLAN